MTTAGIQTELTAMIDERDLAKITKRSIESIRRDRLTGKGPRFVKLGHLVRYDVADVREYLEHNKRGGEVA